MTDDGRLRAVTEDPDRLAATLSPALLSELETLAADVARRCGRLIVDERPDRLGVAATKSSAVDIVTVMDRRSEALATELLARARPDDRLVGEEGLARPGTSGVSWLVDPIDGTVNYLYGVPAFSVSVAAVVGDPLTDGAWRPIAAAVYNPSSDELFRAHEGGGARLEAAGATRELTLAAPAASGLESALVGTGFGYVAEQRARQGRLVAALLPKVRDIRRMGSAALDLCALAAGRLDAYYEEGLNPWDLAGGWLVAAEAGAVVRGLSGGPSRSMTIAGRPELAPALAELVRGLS